LQQLHNGCADRIADVSQSRFVTQGAKDTQGKEVDNAAQVYSIPMIAQGFKKRAK
jgi:hypothetical protein